MAEKEKMVLSPPNHFCVAVKDMGKKLDYFSKLFGLPSTGVWDWDLHNNESRGKKIPSAVRISTMMWQPFSWEIEQWIKGITPVRDFEGREQALSHLGFMVDDCDKWTEYFTSKGWGVSSFFDVEFPMAKGTYDRCALVTPPEPGFIDLALNQLYGDLSVFGKMLPPEQPASAPKMVLPPANHICVAVKDMEKAKDHFSNLFGFAPAAMDSVWDLHNNVSRGEKIPSAVRIATFQWGPIGFEIEQWVKGITPVRDFEGREQAMSHIGFIVEDADKWVNYFKGQGWEVTCYFEVEAPQAKGMYIRCGLVSPPEPGFIDFAFNQIITKK